MENKLKKSIIDLNGGSIKERIDREYAKVLNNIADLNTEATKPREITIKLKITADHERSNPTISITVSSKLQSTHPIKVNLFDTVITDDTGKKSSCATRKPRMCSRTIKH